MFASILAISADAIIIVDESQRITHFNLGAEQIFGYAAADLIGEPLTILLPERYRGAHLGHVQRFAAGAETARRMGERREIFGLRRDGQEFPAEASISKLRMPDGWVFMVVLRDISERKRAEEDQRFLADTGPILSASLDYEETLRAIARLAVPYLADWTAVVVYGQDGGAMRLVSGNPDPGIAAFLSRLGERRARLWDLSGTDQDGSAGAPDQLVPVVTPEFIDARIIHAEDAALLHSRPIASLMIVRLAAHGHIVGSATFVSESSRRRFDEGHLAVARAIAVRAGLAAENARLYQTAQHLTKLRDDILSVVSHDLRNPLSAISMCTRVLLESPPAEESARRELLTAIDDSADWMNRLIQDLLDVGMIEAGRLSLERRPTEMGDVFEQVEAMFAAMAAERGVAIESELPPSLPPVDADGERLLQVLANLVGNALKFTEEGGTVTIGARAEPGVLSVFVRDTGSGIPAEHLPYIFDRWWHARRSAKKAGTGLGLAITKGIVEAHGGRIVAQSTIGEGSTFTFTLPLWSARAARATVPAEPRREPAAGSAIAEEP
jgi:PAS domain S-box-containing protein